MKWRCSDLIIKTDNKEVVQALCKNVTTNKNIDSIIKEIRMLADSFHYFACMKVKWEEVKLAYNLAIHAKKKANCSSFLI